MAVKTFEVVADALEALIVKTEEADIPQSEAAAAIRTLNDMMFEWESKGIYLGYTEVDDMGDVITVPRGAIAGIKTNLALKLAPKYNVTPDPLLIKAAAEGYAAIIDITTEIGAMAYPGNLPQGSGNTYPGYADDTFYGDQQDTILTETGGSIALEDDTEGA